MRRLSLGGQLSHFEVSFFLLCITNSFSALKAMALVRKAMVTSVTGTSSRPGSGRSYEELDDDLIR